MTTNNEHKLYAVKTEDGRFLKGFNPAIQARVLVEDVLEAKMFTNKYEVKLRPNESIVELTVTLSPSNTVASEAFRPRLRQKDLDRNAAHA